jgi:uroporphyrinogen decarboxylase
MTLQNTFQSDHLLLKALRGQEVSRPPVWMMRQAGRYLPSYMQLRRKYDFFTRVQTPELACEITLQPVDQIGVDAAILFSDILVVPQAMGLEVQLVENKGPYLPKTIENRSDINSLVVSEAADRLGYVYEAIRLIKSELNGKVPLIGFAGAPFTLLCYMVEGKGSKNFDKARQFCIRRPDLARMLLASVTEVTTEYLKRQVQAGADVVQVFDSWSGLLSPDDFKAFAEPYLLSIAEALAPLAPVILYPKGSWYALQDLSNSPYVAALGVDWCISPSMARKLTGSTITLQGNFDPAHLHAPVDQIKKEVHRMIREFGHRRYIANLGHGITPDVPVDHARAFVDAVKSYTPDM